MLCRIAADAVLVLHLAFIAFATLGAAAVMRWPRVVWLHLPALAWGLWIELSHGQCPLTGLENRLLECAGLVAYAGGFTERYLLPLIYPVGLLPHHQQLLAALLAAINAVLYALLIRRYRRRPLTSTTASRR